jgi:hypothetical protein
MNSPTKPAKGIPRSIWALGLVSLLMDVSSDRYLCRAACCAAEAAIRIPNIR